jgi:hypothetical protein
MRRTVPILLTIGLGACSSGGASVEEATSATCRDIERWSGEIADVLTESTDYVAPVDALADFQQSLQADADMFREAGKETVAGRIDDWELYVGRLRNGQGRGYDFRTPQSHQFVDAAQDAMEAVKASVSCDGTGST